MSRSCKGVKKNGEPCQAPPLQDEDYCYWHSPTTAAEAAEARRLGGLRRRRERTVAGAYDLGRLEQLSDVRRLVEIAVLDTLSLENSVARSRTLAYLAQTALRVHEAQRIDDAANRPEDNLIRLVKAIESMDVPPPAEWGVDPEEPLIDCK